MTGAPHSSVKRYRDLARNPPKHSLERELLLDGPHLLLEAHRSGITFESAAFEQDAFNDPSIRELADQLVASGTDVLIVSRKTLESMSPVRSPAGAVAIARHSLSPLDAIVTHAGALIVVAHDVQDPGNVGGIVRTAEAAGATGFIATSSSADPLGWKALRGSMGSALRLPIARAEVDDVLRTFLEHGIVPAALVPSGGELLFTVDFTQPTGVIVGSEGAGLPAEVLRRVDRRISIPMTAPVESLNVGVAAALVLYEAFRQRHIR
jgi:RNA methyltransferase, TrmH family